MKLPTKKQIEIYKLIHPEFGNLSVREAADILGINETSAYERIRRMRRKYPEAFRFKKELKDYHNVNNIYEGYRKIAKRKERKFTITLDDLIEIIRMDCFFCGYRATMRTANLDIIENSESDEKHKDTNEELMYEYLEDNTDFHKIAYKPDTGDIFPYNHLWRYDTTEGYTYCNCIAICSFCAMKRRKV